MTDITNNFIAITSSPTSSIASCTFLSFKICCFCMYTYLTSRVLHICNLCILCVRISLHAEWNGVGVVFFSLPTSGVKHVYVHVCVSVRLVVKSCSRRCFLFTCSILFLVIFSIHHTQCEHTECVRVRGRMCVFVAVVMRNGCKHQQWTENAIISL